MTNHEQTHPEVDLSDIVIPTDWTDISYRHDEVPKFMVGSESDDGAIMVVYIGDRTPSSPAHMAMDHRFQVGVIGADGDWTEIGGAASVEQAHEVASQ